MLNILPILYFAPPLSSEPCSPLTNDWYFNLGEEENTFIKFLAYPIGANLEVCHCEFTELL